jgi:hypothetical protein
MNILSKSPQHVMPPDSFTRAPPTSPPTDERSSSVSRIFQEIRNRQQGRSLTDIPWASYELDPKGYEDLLCKLQTDESLSEFVQHKLRYELLILYYITFLSLYIANISPSYTDTIISPPITDLLFEYQHSYTNNLLMTCVTK